MSTHTTSGGFPIGTLSEQIGDLLSQGGNIGMIYDLNQDDYDSLYLLGHTMYTQCRYKDAMKVFGYLNVMDPYERRFANGYASSLQMMGQHEEAFKYYGMVSAMDMRDPVPTFHMCECMIAMGMLVEAASGLGIVVSQCKTPEQSALKLRAQAMLDLLGNPANSVAPAATTSKEI